MTEEIVSGKTLPPTFGKADVPVTLTGEEWTALLGRIVSPDALSLYGAQVYKRATGKLAKQLGAAAQEFKPKPLSELFPADL